MHTVQCPRCRQAFKVSSPLRDAKMRCSRCKQVFVGSSVETPEGAAMPAGSPAAAPPPATEGFPPSPPARPAQPIVGGNVFYSSGLPTPIKARTNRTAIIMVVGCFFGIAALIGMIFAIYYFQTHPIFERRDSATGVVLERRRVPIDEYKRLVAQAEEDARKADAKREEAMRRTALPDDLAALANPRRPVQAPENPLEATTGPATGIEQPVASQPAPAPTEELKEDPNLPVSKEIVSGGTVGELNYVCGRVRSKYPKPLADVTVKAYVRGVPTASVKYPYLPAGGELRYSLKLGEQTVTEADLKVVAAGGKAEENLLVWSVDADQVRRKPEADKVAWSGVVKNQLGVPVRNVKVYLDFFASDGVWSGRATAEIGKPIGVNKSETFSVDFTENLAADIAVVRATGEKY